MKKLIMIPVRDIIGWKHGMTVMLIGKSRDMIIISMEGNYAGLKS
jgi:hypothetical protein